MIMLNFHHKDLIDHNMVTNDSIKNLRSIMINVGKTKITNIGTQHKVLYVSRERYNKFKVLAELSYHEKHIDWTRGKYPRRYPYYVFYTDQYSQFTHLIPNNF